METNGLLSRRQLLKVSVPAIGLAATSLTHAADAWTSGNAIADVMLVDIGHRVRMQQYLLATDAPISLQGQNSTYSVRISPHENQFSRIELYRDDQLISDSFQGNGGYLWHRSGILVMLPGATSRLRADGSLPYAMVGLSPQAPRILWTTRTMRQSGPDVKIDRAGVASAAFEQAPIGTRVFDWTVAYTSGQTRRIQSYSDGWLPLGASLYLVQRVA